MELTSLQGRLWSSGEVAAVSHGTRRHRTVGRVLVAITQAETFQESIRHLNLFLAITTQLLSLYAHYLWICRSIPSCFLHTRDLSVEHTIEWKPNSNKYHKLIHTLFPFWNSEMVTFRVDNLFSSSGRSPNSVSNWTRNPPEWTISRTIQ